MIDVVKDSMDVGPEEDPTLYISEKTKRGPLTATWLEDCIAVRADFLFLIVEGYRSMRKSFIRLLQESRISSRKKKDIMCAYKLCKVDFRYWGMQAKLEKFIHEFGEFRVILSSYKISCSSAKVAQFRELNLLS